MSKLAQITVRCSGAFHHLSVWQPGDAASLDPEYTMVVSNGNLIYVQDHNIEIDLTISDLTGVNYFCLECINHLDSYLTFAAENGRTENVKFAVASGANTRYDNSYGLRWAAFGGYTDIVEILIQNGADVHAENEAPLQWTVEGGHLDTAVLLVNHGAVVTRANISHAKANNYTDLLAFLESRYSPKQELEP
jgi:ankyrin repeat protein